MLAEFINDSSGSKWTHTNAQDRYASLLRTYKNAKSQSMKTGFGCSSDDYLKGVDTIEKKLDQLCPFFQRLDKLFGDRQNVAPSEVAEVMSYNSNE